MSIQKLLTEVEINSVLVREQYYLDTQQWTKLRDLYHPDSTQTTLNLSWFQGDIKGFIDGAKVMATGPGSALHTIQPIEIHVNGGKAISKSTGAVQLRVSFEGNEYECFSYIRYVSRLQKIDGEWKLLSLQVIYIRDLILPVAPLEQPLAIPVDIVGGRQSYKCVTWLLAQRGGKIAQDLPGADNASSVASVLHGCHAWLED